MDFQMMKSGAIHIAVTLVLLSSLQLVKAQAQTGPPAVDEGKPLPENTIQPLRPSECFNDCKGLSLGKYYMYTSLNQQT